MFSETRDEGTDVRQMIGGLSDLIAEFTRDVTIKTKRTLGVAVFDGPKWYGKLDIKAGERFPLHNIERGEKAKPCRLNVLDVRTSTERLEFLDVPEDSYKKHEAVRD